MALIPMHGEGAEPPKLHSSRRASCSWNLTWNTRLAAC